MKNLLLGILMSFTLISNSFAIETDFGYIVDDFLTTTIWGAPQPLLQENTGYGNSCGPTSLMYIYNHYYKSTYGDDHRYFLNHSDSKGVLGWVYSEIGISINKETTFAQLKAFMKGTMGWQGVQRMDAGDSIENNVSYLKDFLRDDTLSLVVLDSSFSRNPTKGDHNIDHIVIVFAYVENASDNTKDRIYFFDPYHGGINYFTVSEIPNAVDLTGFAFLAVSKTNKGTY